MVFGLKQGSGRHQTVAPTVQPRATTLGPNHAANMRPPVPITLIRNGAELGGGGGARHFALAPII